VSGEVGDLLGPPNPAGGPRRSLILRARLQADVSRARRSMAVHLPPMASASTARPMVFSPGRPKAGDFVRLRPMTATKCECGSRDHFERVLQSIVASPWRQPASLPLVAHSMGTMLTARKFCAKPPMDDLATLWRTGSGPWCSPRRTSTMGRVLIPAIIRIGRLARQRSTVIAATNDRRGWRFLRANLAVWDDNGSAAAEKACHRAGSGVLARVVDGVQKAGWGIINHDLFLSNAEVQGG